MVTFSFMSKATTNILVLIPARYQSSRFPGKALATINGKSMIRNIYEKVCKDGLDEVYVVTDDERIEQHVLEFNGKVCRVNDSVATGTERIYLAYKRFFENRKFDFVINLQGDEPSIEASLLLDLAKFHAKHSFDITTLVTNPRKSDDFFIPIA